MLAGCKRNTCGLQATHTQILAPHKDSQKLTFCACTISNNRHTPTNEHYHLAHIHHNLMFTPLPNSPS